MQIPKLAWTLIAFAFIFSGIINILNFYFDPYAFKGSAAPHSLIGGILLITCGLGHFITKIIYKYKAKKP